MNLQDVLALFTFLMVIAGVLFTLGKHAQVAQDNGRDINRIGIKLDSFVDRADRRLDESAKFVVRVDQRVANLERQVYGDNITEILRSGISFNSNDNDDTEPDLVSHL